MKKIIALSLFLVFMLGCYVLATVVFSGHNRKKIVDDLLSQAFDQKVEYSSYEISPTLSPTFTFYDIKMTDPKSDETAFSAEQLMFETDLSRIFQREVKITKLSFLGAVIRVHRDLDRHVWISGQKDSRWFARKFDNPENKADFFNIRWNFNIQTFQLYRSSIHYEDISLQPNTVFQLLESSLMVRRKNADSPWIVNGHGALNGLFEDEFKISGMVDTLRKQFEVDLKSLGLNLLFDISLADYVPIINGKFRLKGLDADRIRLGSSRGESFPLKGILSSSGDFRFDGLPDARLLDRLELKGAVDIRGGSFTGANIPLELLSEMMTESLAQGEKGRERLTRLLGDSDETFFDAFQARIVYQKNGLLGMREVRLKDRAYFLEAEGSYSLKSQELDMRAQLVFMPDMSNELRASYPNLRSVMMQNGRIGVPFYYRGLWPNAASLHTDVDFMQHYHFSLRRENVKVTNVEDHNLEEDVISELENALEEIDTGFEYKDEDNSLEGEELLDLSYTVDDEQDEAERESMMEAALNNVAQSI